MAIKQNQNGQVTFIYQPEIEAKEVFLAGDFNDWDFRRMTRMRDGSFRTRISLSPGEYEYKYVIDGTWSHDPDAKCQIVNPYGEMNSLAQIPRRPGKDRLKEGSKLNCVEKASPMSLFTSQ